MGCSCDDDFHGSCDIAQKVQTIDIKGCTAALNTKELRYTVRISL